MTSLEIHPEAAKRFNEQAAHLIDQLDRPKQTVLDRRTGGFAPDRQVEEIDYRDVSSLQFGETDSFGREIAQYVVLPDETIGLCGMAYKEFDRLAEKIQSQPSFRAHVAISTIKRHLFNWMTKARKREIQEQPMDYLVAACTSDIREYEIWIPIAWLSVQQDFQVGRVQIRQVTGEIYDSWEKSSLDQSSSHGENLADWFHRKKKLYQGFAAGVSTVIADRERAEEIAEADTYLALSILRVFGPATIHPQAISYCQVRGSEHLDSIHAFVLHEGRVSAVNSRMVVQCSPDWVLDSSAIELIQKAGLAKVTQIVQSESRTPYQQSLLDALILYSKVSISSDLSEKLVYLFAALDSMFLKDNKELITQNLAERLAMFIGSDQAERLLIRDRVHEAYALRSKFLHHANKVSDIGTLELFMRDAWRAFHNLVLNKDRFREVKNLLQAIDNSKMK